MSYAALHDVNGASCRVAVKAPSEAALTNAAVKQHGSQLVFSLQPVACALCGFRGRSRPDQIVRVSALFVLGKSSCRNGSILVAQAKLADTAAADIATFAVRVSVENEAVLQAAALCWVSSLSPVGEVMPQEP